MIPGGIHDAPRPIVIRHMISRRRHTHSAGRRIHAPNQHCRPSQGSHAGDLQPLSAPRYEIQKGWAFPLEYRYFPRRQNSILRTRCSYQDILRPKSTSPRLMWDTRRPAGTSPLSQGGTRRAQPGARPKFSHQKKEVGTSYKRKCPRQNARPQHR